MASTTIIMSNPSTTTSSSHSTSIHQQAIVATNTSSSSSSTSSPIPDTKSNECLHDFIRTGRTGRRNAVADVFIDPNICVTTSSITDLMCKFDCNDNNTTNNNEANGAN